MRRPSSDLCLPSLLIFLEVLAFSGMLRAEKKVFVYHCSDGYRFVVSVEGDRAWLFLPNDTLMLERKGDSFTRGDTRFWFGNSKGFLDLGDGEAKACNNNPSEAVWEEAKLRGVDFRAVGNEPGWVMEIEGKRVRLVAQYGTQEMEFDNATPILEDQKTIYRLCNGSHRLTVVLKPGPCRDARGDTYETRVELILDGNRLTGCGMALH